MRNDPDRAELWRYLFLHEPALFMGRAQSPTRICSQVGTTLLYSVFHARDSELEHSMPGYALPPGYAVASRPRAPILAIFEERAAAAKLRVDRVNTVEHCDRFS